jgi:hypothetical protein
MDQIYPKEVEEVVNTYSIGDINVKAHVILSPAGDFASVYSLDYDQVYCSNFSLPEDKEKFEKIVFLMVSRSKPDKIYYN